jgi:hypothetical protein
VPFLTLNGITIPVDVASGVRKLDVVGDRGRSVTGAMLETQNAIKFGIECATKPVIQAEADAYEALLLGKGYSFSFDVDLYSDGKGLAKSAQAGTNTVGAVAGKFGNKITINAASSVTWPTGLTGDYTLMVWRLETAVWHWYVIRKTGGTVEKWKDGAQNNGLSTPWLTVSSGNTVLGDAAAGPDDFDDLVTLPYSIPTSWIAAIFASGVAWTPAPGARRRRDRHERFDDRLHRRGARAAPGRFPVRRRVAGRRTTSPILPDGGLTPCPTTKRPPPLERSPRTPASR